MSKPVSYLIPRDRFSSELHDILGSYGSGLLEHYRPGTLSFERFLEDKMLVVAAIRRGISWSLFSLIQGALPFSLQEWAGFLDISYKTLLRYKKGRKSFKAVQSERIIGLAEVSSLGEEVFGDLQRFKLWLETPSYALGGLRPADLLGDAYGKELVMRELHHIDHGIFA